MGTSYIFYNKAPNEAAKGIFERAKQWMMDAYNTVKKFVKPSPEVAKFFDDLFARESKQLPDITDLKGKSAELAKILQGAASGQELTVSGLSLRDISNLRKVLYARIPQSGMSLADEIRAAGGIDTESYILAVKLAAGVSENEHINLFNTAVLLPILKAIIKVENGQQPYSDDVLLEGIKLAED